MTKPPFDCFDLKHVPWIGEERRFTPEEQEMFSDALFASAKRIPKMIRLEKHDEIVEAMAMVLPRKCHRDLDYINARAALAALLAAVRLEVGREATCHEGMLGKRWDASTVARVSPHFPAIILRMEDRTAARVHAETKYQSQS